MQDRPFEALRQLNMPYAEIRLERRETTRVVYRGDQLVTVDTSLDDGGFARALATHGDWGASTFTGDAIRLAHTFDANPITLAPAKPHIDCVPADLLIDFHTVPLGDKQVLVGGYNDLLLNADPRIESSYIAYSDAFITTWYANTEGAFISQERPLIDLQFTALARDGNNVQRGNKCTHAWKPKRGSNSTRTAECW